MQSIQGRYNISDQNSPKDMKNKIAADFMQL